VKINREKGSSPRNTEEINDFIEREIGSTGACLKIWNEREYDRNIAEKQRLSGIILERD
jgi:hypothetical protein